MKTPQARTLALLRGSGYTVEMVENYVRPQGYQFGWKRDLFGIIDIMAFKDNAFLGAQACAVSGLSSHRRKALASPWLARILSAGWQFVIYGWYPWPDEDRRDEVVTWHAVLKDGKPEFIKGV